MTDQLKLTLASGVVHGLKWINTKSGRVITPTGFQISDSGEIILIEYDKFWNLSIWPFVPMMHPISKLILPILPDGKIPIVELAKKCWFKIFNYEIENFERFEIFSEDKKYGFLAYFENNRIGFSFINDCGFSYFDFSVDGDMLMTNQLDLFDQLDAWHINYRGVEAVEI